MQGCTAEPVPGFGPVFFQQVVHEAFEFGLPGAEADGVHLGVDLAVRADG